MEYQLRSCTEEQLPEILDIYNEAILNTTALYDYKTRTMETMDAWYAEKIKGNYPIIGAFDEQNTLLGFATYGQFRVRPAYKYTIEHSVYVRTDKRGAGLGKILLNELILKATQQDYHVLMGVIDSLNETSIYLHQKAGFTFCGTLKEVGYKFGKWLDADFYQLALKTPLNPNEN